MLTRKSLNAMISLLMIFSLLLGGTVQVSAQGQGAPQSGTDAMPMGPTDETKVPHYFGPWPNYANSSFTVPDVTVEIVGDGVGATAAATAGAGGVITGVTITNSGSGYTTASAVFTSTNPAAAGAAATVTVNTSGTVNSITVDAVGAGYLRPSVTLTGGGASIPAEAIVYGGVDQVTLTGNGLGYSFPTVDFDMPDDPNGIQARGHAEMGSGGTITAVIVDSPGSGYATAPQVTILDGTRYSPVAHAEGTFTPATATTSLLIDSVQLTSFGNGYTSAPMVEIGDLDFAGGGATATAFIDAGAVTGITLDSPGSGYMTEGGIKKFQDGLPVLCIPGTGQTFADCTNNNLGQHIPVAVPDDTTFPGADYYVIAVVQHREQMHSDLPPTLVREYVQLETAANASFSKSVQLETALLDGTTTPTMMPDGVTRAVAVDDPHFLGPVIVARKDRPVRILFYNLLPTGVDGDLFMPVDTTFMGAGMGPMEMMPMMDMGSVEDMIRNPACGKANKTMMERMDCFADNRATLHLHGGITPWISDGSPHQWITPADEMTGWPEGVSVRQVPDMVGAGAPTNVPDCSAADDGCMTFYYTNQQSARLMFYHDHSWGITRLNVYAGEAAGYVIRDDTEDSLISRGLLPSGADEIPLVIQDRTFLPNAAQVAEQDPTWDYSRWGGEGNFWYEHVYMPAQNPGDPGGMSAYGRWMYGPWFWPPADAEFGPIANPYYNMDPLGEDGIRGTMDDWLTPLAVDCSLDDPATWQYDTDPFCEPPLIPGTPNNSAGMEQFNDTPIVNGTAYPTVTLEPKAYRLRILNAANDRFWNLQWYQGDLRTADPILGPTEVALKASEVEAAQTDPNVFPTPDMTYSPAGPDWIQIGTEGGFLPAPVVIDGQQHTTWIIDPTVFNVGLVDQHSLLLGPAERADVIVDFSQFAGKTLILYNDAPAAFPARVASYDYYTGAPDMSPNGAPAILPGYGPNTRTIMQVKIAPSAPANPYNVAALKAAFKHQANGSGVFESGQHPIIVGQAGYNSAYGSSFASGAWCNSPTNPSPKCDGYARISEQGGETFKFDTLSGLQVGVKIEPKAIHDETNATTFEPFGRMSGNLGVEVTPATPGTQNVVLLPFVNPPTELFDGTNLPTTANITPISVASDGTQIWKFTHNGVDTHPIHFHLYDVQLLNRVSWDNIVSPPEPNELGWKDTVRVSPLEDTYFAIRPIIPVLPWEIPNSIRPINPMMPIGDTTMFNPVNPAGTNAPISNQLINFGWEYMLHCHILSHEEMDMMRPVTLAMPPIKPVIVGFDTATNTLTWNDNSITETDFLVQRSTTPNVWEDVGTIDSPIDPDVRVNVHEVRTMVDNGYTGADTQYRVIAKNTIGYGGLYPSLTAESVSNVLTVGNAFPPQVVSVVRASPNPSSAPSVNFTVTFSDVVTGVDVADFSPLSSGTVSGPSVSNVTPTAGGNGAIYTVSVNTGTGTGTLGLALIDNDTIADAQPVPLGGVGTYVPGANPPAPGDGSFMTGQTYTVDYTVPTVVSSVRLNPSPTALGMVSFRVSFSEPVTGVDLADFSLATTGTIANASIISRTGSGAIYTVNVNTGTGSGTITLNVVDNDSIRDAQVLPLGGLGLGNGDFTTGQSYTIDRNPPAVSSIVRASADPTSAASVNFTVTFLESVTGADPTDFALTTSGTIAGASIASVTGSGITRTVSVNTGTGAGTLRLDVVDNDSIKDIVGNSLGGSGAGNGNFNTGQEYTIDKTVPTVVSSVRLNSNPNALNTVFFSVTFSEAVTGVDAVDFSLYTTGVTGASIASVSGTGATRTVAVSTGTGSGTLRLDIVDNDTIKDVAANSLGGSGAGNGNFNTGQEYTITKP